MKILIAEDNPISLKMLEKTIRDWGYSVYMTEDGKKAWELLQKHKIRIAILDWMMPGLNGIDLCKKIRRRKKDFYTYIILLTSRDNSCDVIEGLMSGSDDYIVKPFDPQELKARIQTGRRIIQLENQLLLTQKRLHKLATKDSLTKIWNREAILQILEEENIRSEREKGIYSTIMIDIDDFKNINDTFGHQVGDKVLAEVAAILNKNLRRYDKIGRYGGDEILAVLPNCGGEELKNISQRLCKAVNDRHMETSKGPVKVTISLGGTSSVYNPQPSSQQMLIESDTALYAAKRRGRSQYAVVKNSDLEEGVKDGS